MGAAARGPRVNRRDLVTSRVQAAPWLISSRQPTAWFGRPERVGTYRAQEVFLGCTAGFSLPWDISTVA